MLVCPGRFFAASSDFSASNFCLTNRFFLAGLGMGECMGLENFAVAFSFSVAFSFLGISMDDNKFTVGRGLGLDG
jgi:hypothetical protein